MTMMVFILGAYGASSTDAAPESTTLNVGDRLVYAVTVELQQHHIAAGPKARESTAESSAQGTATFSVYAIGSDGTAYANVALDFKGVDQGRPLELQQSSTGKILSDGQLRLQAQVGLGVSDAIAFANSTTTEINRHAPLGAGKTWTNAAKTPFVSLTMKRKVVGEMRYRGVTAYALQSQGSGQLVKTADGKPTSGNITVSGTTYYDDKNRLLVGEALQTLTVVTQPGSRSAHDDYAAALNVVLDSWTHATARAQPAQPEEAPASPEPSATPLAPGPPPTMFGPTPYPTVTPRQGT